MTFLPTFFLVLILAGASCATEAYLDTLNPVQILVGIDGDNIPLTYSDPHKGLTGFEIELAREACRRAHLVPRFINIAAPRLTRSLREGTIDLAWSGIILTPDVQTQFLTSRPYLDSRLIALSRPNSTLRNLRDLPGLRVGYPASAPGNGKLFSSRLISCPSNLDCIAELTQGRLDAIVMDEFAVHLFSALTFDPVPIRLLEGDLGKRKLVFLARPSDTRLVERLDSAISSMAIDGTLAKLRNKWFPPSFLIRIASSPRPR